MAVNGSIVLLIIIVVIIFAVTMYNGKCSNDYYMGEGDYKLEDNAYSKYQLPSYSLAHTKLQSDLQGGSDYKEGYYQNCPPCVQKINPCAATLPDVYSPGATSNYYGSGCFDPFDKYEGTLKSY